MEITVSQAQGRVGVTILQPHGDLDAASYTDLIAAAQDARQAGALDILLDLGDTPYLSSSGLVALQSIASLMRDEEPTDLEAGWDAIRAIKRGPEAGCQAHFKLLNPRPRVARVLEMVGFSQFLEVYDDLQDVVASF